MWQRAASGRNQRGRHWPCRPAAAVADRYRRRQVPNLRRHRGERGRRRTATSG